MIKSGTKEEIENNSSMMDENSVGRVNLADEIEQASDEGLENANDIVQRGGENGRSQPPSTARPMCR